MKLLTSNLMFLTFTFGSKLERHFCCLFFLFFCFGVWVKIQLIFAHCVAKNSSLLADSLAIMNWYCSLFLANPLVSNQKCINKHCFEMHRRKQGQGESTGEMLSGLAPLSCAPCLLCEEVPDLIQGESRMTNGNVCMLGPERSFLRLCKDIRK